MNLPSLLILLLVAAALFLALRAYLHGRGRCSCGCGSSCDAPVGCSGKRSSACTGCPYCQGK